MKKIKNTTNKIKNKEEMDIVFILDRSGSMSGAEEDTIGGYNSYIENRKKENIRITTVLFDDKYEMLYNRRKITDIKKLTNKEYFVRGGTALLDAIGKTIKHMDYNESKKAIFIITTDGLENASREYTKEKIKELITAHSNWEFIYIGANIDSYSEGQSIGIKSQNISNYKKDRRGIFNLFNAVGKICDLYLDDEYIDESWKSSLEE